MDLPYNPGISPSYNIRGMIASRDIRKGEDIEKCPVVIIPKSERETVDRTILRNYYFDWTKETVAIVFGYASLINHSYTPNADYCMDYVRKRLIIYSLKPIKQGSEVTINYNGWPDSRIPLPPEWTDFH